MAERPFSLLEINKIYHLNCLDLIQEFPDSFVDATITDYQSNHREVKFRKIENDERPYVDWIEPLYPKMSEGGRLICFYRYDVQEELLSEIERVGFKIKSQLVWDKGNWSSGDLKSGFGIMHELMIYATKGKYEFKNGRPSTIYRAPRVDAQKMIHPNEKPVSLNQALIRDVTSVGELIFDPFSGSGSLARAAKAEGRDFIACDLGLDYVTKGNLLVQNTKRNLL